MCRMEGYTGRINTQDKDEQGKLNDVCKRNTSKLREREKKKDE